MYFFIQGCFDIYLSETLPKLCRLRYNTFSRYLVWPVQGLPVIVVALVYTSLVFCFLYD